MPKPPPPPPAPRLMLVLPPLGEAEAHPAFAAACGRTDVAAVVVPVEVTDERSVIKRLKRLVPALQAGGAAVLVAGLPEVVARAGADGAHAASLAALDAVDEALGDGFIRGVGGLATRHDAMEAGEAEADYVMFGEPDARGLLPPFPAVVERVAWWAELFEIPCVGYAPDAGAVAVLAGAGADFVALGPWVLEAADPLEAILEAGRVLAGYPVAAEATP